MDKDIRYSSPCTIDHGVGQPSKLAGEIPLLGTNQIQIVNCDFSKQNRVLYFIMESSCDEDSNTTEARNSFDQDQQRRQEQLQKKLYFLSENLKTIHSRLPMWVIRATHRYVSSSKDEIHLWYYLSTVFLVSVSFRKYQMRIPYELLTELANSLLNDTVFEIVKGLMEIQVNPGCYYISYCSSRVLYFSMSQRSTSQASASKLRSSRNVRLIRGGRINAN